MKIYINHMQTPLGLIRLYAIEEGLIGLFMQEEKRGPLHQSLQSAIMRKTDILCQAEEELHLYFAGQKTSFAVPIRFFGTEFQKSVWHQLQNIGAGELQSYSEVARKISHPTAVRAVGAAIGSNPIGIVVPCHRVVSKIGELTGYAGGIAAKAWLLNHEGHTMKNRVVLAKRKT